MTPDLRPAHVHNGHNSSCLQSLPKDRCQLHDCVSSHEQGSEDSRRWPSFSTLMEMIVSPYTICLSPQLGQAAVCVAAGLFFGVWPTTFTLTPHLQRHLAT